MSNQYSGTVLANNTHMIYLKGGVNYGNTKRSWMAR